MEHKLCHEDSLFRVGVTSKSWGFPMVWSASLRSMSITERILSFGTRRQENSGTSHNRPLSVFSPLVPVAWAFGSDNEDTISTSTRDFKVVVIMTTTLGSRRTKVHYALLYSKRSDSWKQLRCLNVDYGFFESRAVAMAVAVNRDFYWKTNNCLLSFSLCDDHKLDYGMHSIYDYHLTKWQGTLACGDNEFWQLSYDLTDQSELLTQRVYKWTKLFQLGPGFNFFQFRAVWEDEFLMVNYECGFHSRKMTLFDEPFISNKEMIGNEHDQKRRSPLSVSSPSWVFGEAHDYVPGLVSVYPNNKQEQADTVSEEKIGPTSQ